MHEQALSLHRFGLGERDATMQMIMNDLNMGEATLESTAFRDHGGSAKTFEVEIKRLDDLWPKLGDVAFVKIDVEGHEAAVLRGGAQSLAQSMPIIVFEQNGEGVQNGSSETVQVLLGMGYKICTIEKQAVSGVSVSGALATLRKIFAGNAYRLSSVRSAGCPKLYDADCDPAARPGADAPSAPIQRAQMSAIVMVSSRLRELLKLVARKVGLEVRQSGPHARSDLRLAQFLRRQNIGLVYDVGANRGQFALGLIRSGYPGHIVSFEAVPAAHVELTVQASGFQDRWFIAPQLALSDQDGETEFHINVSDTTSSLLAATAASAERIGGIGHPGHFAGA